MAQRHSSRTPAIVLGSVLAITIVLVIAEIALRVHISGVVDEEFRTAPPQQGVTVQQDTETSFGAFPLLLDLITGTIDEIDVVSPSTLDIQNADAAGGAVPSVRGVPAATTTLYNVSVGNPEESVAERVRITATIPAELIMAEANLNRPAPQGDSILDNITGEVTRMSAVRPDPARGVLVAEFARGAASVDILPVVRDGQVVAEVSGGDIGGLSADGVVATIADAAVAEPTAAINDDLLQITAVRVTDEGLAVDLEGTNIAVTALRTIDYSRE
ncbi:DUF2993 domain-containing protein [Corynebacterium sp. TAE3-ERU12]|uniref:DUF2993 domain-containing protein n=1 Tax=Corynebacterium sp. TAE3-ERU12 TaxID=2849491 RepID=UPI001C458CF2|nr:DUF2993 domain-containing protein [Corynebacterium sp. TAE3-ERU12]MBV7294525.1 DUF2993 domain-containing protein [Corynebacterium sp. TAE3-ERU12]